MSKLDILIETGLVTSHVGSTAKCYLCLKDNMSKQGSDPRKVNCGHIFHHICIRVYLTIPGNEKCPVCNHRLHTPTVPVEEAVKIANNKCYFYGEFSSFDFFGFEAAYETNTIRRAVKRAGAHVRRDEAFNLLPKRSKADVNLAKVSPHLISFGNFLVCYRSAHIRPFSPRESDQWREVIKGRHQNLEMLETPDNSKEFKATELRFLLAANVHKQLGKKGIDIRGTGCISDPSREPLPLYQGSVLELLLKFTMLVCQESLFQSKQNRDAIRSVAEVSKWF